MKPIVNKEGKLLSWIEGLSDTTLDKIIAVLSMVLYRAEIKNNNSHIQNVLVIGLGDFTDIQSNKNEIIDVLEKVSTSFNLNLLDNRHSYTLAKDVFRKPKDKDIYININPDIIKILNLSIKKIHSVQDKRNKDKGRKAVFFDVDKSRFYVQDEEIKILKFKDEYHTLRVMFENLNELPKEWFFSEIAERIDKYNFDDKKYYNAIYQLKLKLERKGIKDFFITTKQSVKITPKYLS